MEAPDLAGRKGLGGGCVCGEGSRVAVGHSRGAAVHAKWSQLPLVYGLIPALLQPVIQGKLLSLVVKHF